MWWYTQDEERWNGPCSDREEAIDLGRDEFNGESFMVMEADTGDYELKICGQRIIECLDEINEDRSDPEGDPAFYSVTPEQAKDLETRVERAVRAWAAKHHINTSAWCFTTLGKAETIPEEPEST